MELLPRVVPEAALGIWEFLNTVSVDLRHPGSVREVDAVRQAIKDN